MTLLDDIKAANESVAAAEAFEHPQYIDGVLYVTPEQYGALRDWGTETALKTSLGPEWNRPSPAVDIPVQVIKPGDTVYGKNGLALMYSTVTKELYAVDTKKLAGGVSWSSRSHVRPPR